MTKRQREFLLGFASASRAMDLNPQSAFLLVAVADNPGMTATDIADIMGVTPSGVSRAITKLLPRNMLLVESAAGMAGRRLDLRLTEYGRQVVDGLCRGEVTMQGDPSEGL